MTGLCPHCGYNLAADEEIAQGGWRLDPRRGAFYHGKLVVRRPSWTNILHALAKADGALVKSEALLGRVSECERNNTIASQISQLRKHIRQQGVPVPIGTVRAQAGSGYFWEQAA